ncbi:MAG: HIT family protein [Bacteroidetes bacterium]|nr:HIT family protein [Bacteroidota bacterium]
MASIFSRIVAGEIPSYKVAETAHCYAFLDINPLVEGHTLVIPKKEIDYLFDLEDPIYNELFLFSKRIAVAIKNAFPCQKVGVAVIGLEVFHAHIHLIPLQSMSDIDFKRPKLKLSPEQFQLIAEKIRKALGE